jgi:glutathione synthase/RimK-type ligase-like ATP-grasp enzyme
MKKIGVLFGMERSFPEAFVERVNKMGLKDIHAEPVVVDMVQQGVGDDYAVIIDRISQDVPFYRAYLKNAAISGTAVINNPFWWSADEKFFNNALAVKLGVPVPKTVILPSHEKPTDTQDSSFSNLKFPLSWEKIFEHIGWPAYMKPHAGGGWKSVYKLNNLEDFFKAYKETAQLVMMLQEEIIFTEYFRCYCLGRKYVRVMQYEPRNPHHLRYVVNGPPASAKLVKKVHDYVLDLCNALGYDFNTVEMAVRDGVPYAIDFCNPAPDADVKSVGLENFEWVVEHAAKMAVERARAQQPGRDNLTWGTFVRQSVADFEHPISKPKPKAKEKPIKAAKKKSAKK